MEKKPNTCNNAVEKRAIQPTTLNVSKLKCFFGYFRNQIVTFMQGHLSKKAK